MKIVIDIPEIAYEAYKEWHKNKVATVEESLIAHGTPYKERPQGEWEDYSEDFYKCPECGYLLNKLCPQCHNKVTLPSEANTQVKDELNRVKNELEEVDNAEGC